MDRFKSADRREASILHADLDSFYASVEQRDDPALRGKPVLVGGGVVLAASYEAKAYGVQGAMGGVMARRLCPHAIVVAPRFEAYTEASRAVFAIFDDVTPLVEGISIDEAFLDVGGLRRLSGPPADIATRLRARVLTEVGLPISVGIARTKFLAKVASRQAKPNGLLLVPPETELEFLHPLPVDALWGVGPVTTGKLAERGIHTVGEVATLAPDVLTSMLGPAAGRQLFALSHNHDPRPVVVGRRRKSIGSQSAFGRGRRTPAEVDALVIGIVDRVMRRVRAANRVGRTVVLRLRFDDFASVTRSHTLPAPTDDTATVLAAIQALMTAAAALIAERGLTLVGVSVPDLDDDDAVQLALPFPRAANGAVSAPDTGVLDATLDAVRERFGTAAIDRAVLIGRSTGVEVPKLPD
ncbi:DNA polymerase IV [Sporichthya sp.]|uniref:DNA polymerase IV n=1 Tax=Sporichthya sp. TaxID=65475 RepID=UPI0018566B4B|nr:DNA polymerase IV [Sporichthya sp.]MBA3745771.1 DNA polymerase IV [Sporichthya sp.]